MKRASDGNIRKRVSRIFSEAEDNEMLGYDMTLRKLRSKKVVDDVVASMQHSFIGSDDKLALSELATRFANRLCNDIKSTCEHVINKHSRLSLEAQHAILLAACYSFKTTSFIITRANEADINHYFDKSIAKPIFQTISDSKATNIDSVDDLLRRGGGLIIFPTVKHIDFALKMLKLVRGGANSDVHFKFAVSIDTNLLQEVKRMDGFHSLTGQLLRKQPPIESPAIVPQLVVKAKLKISEQEEQKQRKLIDGISANDPIVLSCETSDEEGGSSCEILKEGEHNGTFVFPDKDECKDCETLDDAGSNESGETATNNLKILDDCGKVEYDSDTRRNVDASCVSSPTLDDQAGNEEDTSTYDGHILRQNTPVAPGNGGMACPNTAGHTF